MGSPNSTVRSCATLGRGHKISLPAYYVPIEEVEVPATSTPNAQQQQQHQHPHPHPHHSGRTSTPNVSLRANEDGLAPTTSTPNHTTTYPTPEILSPIPAVTGIQADLRAPGSRSSISSVNSQQSNGIRKKIPPAVAPKPSGLVNSRRGSYAEDYSGASSPVKIAPKPPPKPKKRLSIAGSERLDEEDAPFEDEGEDGTEV